MAGKRDSLCRCRSSAEGLLAGHDHQSDQAVVQVLDSEVRHYMPQHVAIVQLKAAPRWRSTSDRMQHEYETHQEQWKL